jgi:putative DeoR family transcriptional regulator (stage III sporulation protein D)
MMYCSSHKERCVRFAEFLIAHRTTVRATAAHFGISKSTVHKDVSQKLKTINPALHRQVQQILEQNKEERHLRGGEATKQKYLLKLEQNKLL